MYRVKSGALHPYVYDPAGNKVEVNYPDDDVDRSAVQHLVDRVEVAEPPEGRGTVQMYTDELLSAIGR